MASVWVVWRMVCSQLLSRSLESPSAGMSAQDCRSPLMRAVKLQSEGHLASFERRRRPAHDHVRY